MAQLIKRIFYEYFNFKSISKHILGHEYRLQVFDIK